MKKFAAILVLFLASLPFTRLRGQDNPYQIHNDCYEWMVKADALIGKEGFDEAKTRFIQNMTHELRTPLNAITGFSQLLSLPDGMFPQEEKEEFSSHIINNTKMLTMLLDDILNASAMELPYAFSSDPLRIQQVLTNLLTNACKYITEGEIRLICSLDETPGMLTFSVEDSGPGVPASEAENIFNRFVKLDDFVQGTGLGLSICREIADKMGGRVFLDTGYTGGARFVFCIPV